MSFLRRCTYREVHLFRIFEFRRQEGRKEGIARCSYYSTINTRSSPQACAMRCYCTRRMQGCFCFLVFLFLLSLFFVFVLVRETLIIMFITIPNNINGSSTIRSPFEVWSFFKKRHGRGEANMIYDFYF